MENPNAYRGLNFGAQFHPRSGRMIAVVATSAVFVVLWWLVPHGALFWLLLPAVAILGWMATYGWRQANSHLIHFLQSLDHE